MKFRELFLGQPLVFALFKFLIGVPKRTEQIVADYIQPNCQSVILDIGCGYGDYAKALSNATYIGIDFNEAYIRRAQKKYSRFGQFYCCDVSDFQDYVKDVVPSTVILIGVLHHLEDVTVRRLLNDVSGVLESGGKLVSVDPVFYKGQPFFDHLLAQKDRGRFVRSVADLTSLFPIQFELKHVDLKRDWLRIPYTHVVCVAIRR